MRENRKREKSQARDSGRKEDNVPQRGAGEKKVQGSDPKPSSVSTPSVCAVLAPKIGMRLIK